MSINENKCKNGNLQFYFYFSFFIGSNFYFSFLMVPSSKCKGIHSGDWFKMFFVCLFFWRWGWADHRLWEKLNIFNRWLEKNGGSSWEWWKLMTQNYSGKGKVKIFLGFMHIPLLLWDPPRLHSDFKTKPSSS